MTNGLAAITDLTLDGTSLQEDPIGIHLEITKGLNEIPKMRGVDVVAAHRTGRIAYPRLADAVTLELEGVVLGVPVAFTDPSGQASYRTKAEALKALLISAALDVAVLAGTLEDGSAATINVRVVDHQVTEQVASLAAEVRVALESVDPYWVVTPAGP